MREGITLGRAAISTALLSPREKLQEPFAVRRLIMCRFIYAAALVVVSGLAAPAWAAPWLPTMSDAMQWILQGTVRFTSPATVYDIDGFDNPAATVTRLHRLRRHVVCYINVGSWEDWRPDAGSFPKSVLGKVYPGFPDERFLDIRSLAILQPIMARRFRMCRAKGFDAIEPDNIDTFQADTGFRTTAADELAYIRWLIREAHGLGLSIGQKNDGDQTSALEPLMDWALTEECFFGQFCDQFTAYPAHHKRVFNTEYREDTTPATFLSDCRANAQLYHFAMELKPVALTSWRMGCNGVATR